VNGIVTNIPSCSLKAGDVVTVRGKSQGLEIVLESLGENAQNVRKFPWLEWDSTKMEGTFIQAPTRAEVPEKINEQLIVELYSK
jgi:small subunit ribosomal protein S4